MLIRRIIPIAILLLPVFLPAQVRFTAIVNETQINRNDNLQVQYVIENAKSIDQFNVPVFKQFRLLQQPFQSNGSSNINGVLTQYYSIILLLQPITTGKLTIPGASAIIDGKLMRSNSSTVMVSNKNSSQPANVSPFGFPSVEPSPPEVNEEYILKPGESIADKIKNNLLVKLDVSKTSCYEGEAVVATYKLCSRLKSESRVTKRPSLNGFSVYDMVQPESNNPGIEKINGKAFNVHLIRKVQLYPLQEGSFELDPVELDNTVRFVRLNNASGKSSMQQLLDDYINGVSEGKMEEQNITLASKPVTITVKPLPANGKPVSFDGAVGKFTIRASMDRLTVEPDEQAHLYVEIKGIGNLPLINAPAITWPAGIEATEPSVKEALDKSIAPISGTKVFDYAFTIKEPGKHPIPAVEFSYFDPSSNSYKILRSDSMLLTVTKASGKKTAITDNNSHAIAVPDQFNPLKLLWIIPVIIMLLLGFFAWRKRKQQAALAVKKAEQAAAAIPVVDPLEGAKYALYEMNGPGFYKEIGNCIWNSLAAKLRITSSQLNKPAVIALLKQKNTSPAVITQLESVLLECEMALYTPVHSENDMKATLDKTENILKEVAAIS